MSKLFYSAVLVIISINLSIACTFIPNPFCQQFDNGNTILYGKTIGLVDDGVEFQIFDILSGSETDEIITIYDQAPFDCNGTFYLNAELLLPLDLEVIVSLEKIDTLLNPWEEIGDYRVPEFYTDTRRLIVENENVTGVISSPFSEQTISLDDFIAAVQNGDADCSLVLNVGNEYTDDVIMSPNPATDFVYLSSSDNRVIQIAQSIVYSQVGYQSHLNLDSDNKFDVSHLPVGMYVIEVLYTDGLRSRHKIVVVR